MACSVLSADDAHVPISSDRRGHLCCRNAASPASRLLRAISKREPERVIDAWSLWVGSRQKLVQRLATTIFQSGAREVVILDPRHGATCHVDHRAISILVLEAVNILGANGPEEVFLAETLVQPDLLAGVVRFRPAVPSDPEIVVFNANAPRPNGRSLWEFTTLDVALHPSQFDSSTILALENTPFSDRVLHFIRLSEADLTDPRYAGFCR